MTRNIYSNSLTTVVGILTPDRPIITMTTAYTVVRRPTIVKVMMRPLNSKEPVSELVSRSSTRTPRLSQDRMRDTEMELSVCVSE